MREIVPYSKQSINQKDIKVIKNVLKSDFLTQGPIVQRFEKSFAMYVNANYATTFNSATSALHASCFALDFKEKDILWTVPNTFVASANCGLYLNGIVDFVDINFRSGNIDINLLEKKLKSTKCKFLPKILVTVDFAGLPVQQDLIWKLSKKYKFKIIEDASHALGAKYKNYKVGSCNWSHITVFSFHPVKTITTGEGGMATTNNSLLYQKLQMFRSHGITKNWHDFKFKSHDKKKWYYEQHYLGYNYRMNEISAALGINQLKRIGTFVKKRNLIAKYYSKNLNINNIILPNIDNNSYSSFHLYIIKVIGKKFKKIHFDLFNFLRKNKFFIQVHYLPVHLHPFYRKMGFRPGDFPNSEKHSSSAISLPIYPDLKKTQIDRIIKLIKIFFTKKSK
jgi:UDP-4-amino-4,6-dideoxy-N-acetyl-beta-L-altrosamine transaminase